MAARSIDAMEYGAGGFPAAPPVRHGAFKAAFRHSRRVKWLRRLLPVVALVGLALVVAASLFNPLRLLNLPIEVGGFSFNGSRLSMEAPRLSGYTDDNRLYRLSAERADQEVGQTHLVELARINAALALQGGGTATMNAARGRLDTRTNRVELLDRVLVETTTGYRGETTKASVDTKTGLVVVEAPIELAAPSGAMRSERMEVRDGGKTFVFDGAVSGTFTPAPPEPRAPIVPADDPPAPGARPASAAPDPIPPAATMSPSSLRLMTAPLPAPRP